MIAGHVTINKNRPQVLKLNASWWLSFQRPIMGWIYFFGRLRNGTMRVGPLLTTWAWYR